MKVKHRLTGMSFIPVIDGARLKHKDYLPVKEFYKRCHDWLVEKGYAPSSDAKFPEKYYHHRTTQQAGEEVRFRWYLTKNINFFFDYEVDLKFVILGMKSAEVLRNGVKFKSNHAEVEITMDARLVMDPSGKFRDHWFTGNFYSLFTNRIYGGQIVQHKYQLMKDMNDFREYMKTVFKLQVYQPEVEGQRFFPTKDFE